MIWADRVAIGFTFLAVLLFLLISGGSPIVIQNGAEASAGMGGILWLALRTIDFIGTGRIRIK